ncbi:helix-turn-helix transcriptional regulator [Desulfoluna spongiiphila]|uniref:helix-turn-helix transcriptional regulator n=1 Tax=Desulfoluna spongiiphila TaxID=419481 RepID=UPI00125259B6|nr:AraC family transcriptional regulator [Desulfoluna spongiiphila]VVS94541.1 transcription regulator hth arac- type [Desulfoluna spongiiphila]
MHTISIKDFDDFLTEKLIQNCDSYRENQKAWESKTGSGTVNEIPFRPGLNLLIEHFDFNAPVTAAMKVQPSPIEIFFCVSGKLEGHALDIDRKLIIDAGNASFFLAPELQCNTVISSHEPLKLITIRFSPEVLCAEIKDLANVLPPQITDSQSLTNETSIISHLPMTSDMKMAIIQILSCPYTDAFRRLYLESKAIELIVLYFASMQKAQGDFQFNAPAFTPSEIARIHEAKAILRKDFENPPHLNELARQVGMNKDKLNQGFHKVFGTSVFGCFKQQKMEEAKKLLESKEMNVTEVAYTVGYSQPGTFSRAFKQYYGINPKAYHQRVSTEL